MRRPSATSSLPTFGRAVAVALLLGSGSVGCIRLPSGSADLERRVAVARDTARLRSFIDELARCADDARDTPGEWHGTLVIGSGTCTQMACRVCGTVNLGVCRKTVACRDRPCCNACGGDLLLTDLGNDGALRVIMPTGIRSGWGAKDCSVDALPHELASVRVRGSVRPGTYELEVSSLCVVGPPMTGPWSRWPR